MSSSGGAALAGSAAAAITVGQMIWVTQGSTQHAAHVLETNKDNGQLFIRWDSNCATEWIGPDVPVSTELPSRRRGSKPVYDETKLLTKLVLKEQPKKPQDNNKKSKPKRAASSASTGTSRSKRSSTTSRSRRKEARKKRKEIYVEEESEEEEEEEEDAIVPERQLPERSSKRARISYADGDSDLDKDDDLAAAEVEIEVEPDLQSRSSRTSNRKKGKSISSKDTTTASANEEEEEDDEKMGDISHDAFQYAVGTSVAKKCKRRGWVSGTIVSTAGSFYRVKFSGNNREHVKGSDIGQMVYDADTTRYPIGTSIKKRFSDSVLNPGKVIRIENSLYHVLYKDGAEEILGASEMDELVTSSSSSSSSKRKKSNSLAAKAGSVAMINWSNNREEGLATQTAGQCTDSDGVPRTRTEAATTTSNNHDEEIPPSTSNDAAVTRKPPPDPPSEIIATRKDSSRVEVECDDDQTNPVEDGAVSPIKEMLILEESDKPELKEQAETAIIVRPETPGASPPPPALEAKPNEEGTAPDEASTGKIIETEKAPSLEIEEQTATNGEGSLAPNGKPTATVEPETNQDVATKTVEAKISTVESEKSAPNGDMAAEVDQSTGVPEAESQEDASTSVVPKEDKLVCDQVEDGEPENDRNKQGAPTISEVNIQDNSDELLSTPADAGLKESEEGNSEAITSQLPAPDKQGEPAHNIRSSEGASSNEKESSTTETTTTKLNEEIIDASNGENAATKDTVETPKVQEKKVEEPSDRLSFVAATTIETSTKSKPNKVAHATVGGASSGKKRGISSKDQQEAKRARQQHEEGLSFIGAGSRGSFASLASQSKISRGFAEPPGISQTSQGATKYKDNYMEPFDPNKKAGTYAMSLQPAEHKASSRPRARQAKSIGQRMAGTHVQDSAAKRIALALERTAKSKEEQRRPKQVNADPSPKSGTVLREEQKRAQQTKAAVTSPTTGSFSSRNPMKNLPASARLEAATLQSSHQTRQDAGTWYRAQREREASQNAIAQQFRQGLYGGGSAPWNASSTTLGANSLQRNTVPYKMPNADRNHTARKGVYDDAPESGAQRGRSDASYYQRRKELPLNLHRHTDPAIYFALNRPTASFSNQRAAPARGLETYISGSRTQPGAASNHPMPSAPSFAGHSAANSAMGASYGFPAVGHGIASQSNSLAGYFSSRQPRASVDPPGEVAKKDKKGATK